MPQIVVTGRDGQISAKNREHAEAKIERLERYFDGIEKIEAVLGHSGDEAAVEVIISVRKGRPIVCHSSAKDLYAAIDRVLDKAEGLLTKFKEKLKAHHKKGDRARSSRAKAPEPLAEGQDDE